MILMTGCGKSEPPKKLPIEPHQDSVSINHDSLNRIAFDSGISSSIACRILAAPEFLFDSLPGRTRYMLHGYDSCVLELIDHIADRFIATRERRYLVLIDSVYSFSDGYVMEYVGVVFDRLFMEATPQFLDYANSSEHRKGFLGLLMNEWRYDLSGVPDGDQKLLRIQHSVDSLLSDRPASDRRLIQEIIAEARKVDTTG